MQKLGYKVSVAFVVLAAIVWGLIGLSKVNIIDRIIGKNVFSRGIYLLMGISALVLAFNRDSYLPFLGESIFPCSLLQEQTPPGATRTVTVHVSPNVKVLYWASEPTDGGEIKSFEEAYNKYKNAGVTTSDHNGFAILKVREPQSYTVPLRTLDAHVHYRECTSSEFIGRVKTIYLKHTK
jgi:uncharacterized membrane protein YuzA (DUF378 family)